MQARISMITLGVRDMERAVAFYQQGLGFPKLDSPPTVAFFNLQGTWLGLYPQQALAEDVGVENNGTGFRAVTLAHNVESELEVDQIIAQAVAAGATLIKTPQTVFWGGYSGYFADPDGHLWEVAFNPFMWVGPKSEDA